MGLGKTIQAISFLGFLQHVQQITGPFLVVVPLSTLPNWEAEFEKWLPDCNVVIYGGDGKSRAIIQDYEFFSPSAPNVPKFNVLLTTYEIVLKDREPLSAIRWNNLVVDEAHRLKNAESTLHDVLDGFETGCRLLITGTPLQNSLKELWSLMHFIEPKKFPNFALFEQKYGQLGHESQLTQLHAELKPHLLRRLKKDVEKSLPEKNEKILRVPLSTLQRQYYRWVLTRNFKELNKGVTGQSAATLSNIMIELKKVCNHPYLFGNAEEAHGKSLYPDLTPQQALVANSGKMVVLDRLLRHLHGTGHRVLIFSQMVRMLDLLGDLMRISGYQFQRLDGSSTRMERQRAMEAFNSESSRDFCFLLSTRAGGLGINLSTADTVIIFDSDWNPQNDLQAEARAHRIGQKNVVSIYRLVSQNSVEENILARAKKKLALDQLVIQRLNTKSGPSSGNSSPTASPVVGGSTGSNWQKSELAEVIRHGAQEIFRTENDKLADQELRELDILSLLQMHDESSENRDDQDSLNGFKLNEFKQNSDSSTANGASPTQFENFWDSVIPAEERQRLDEEEQLRKQIVVPLGPRRARGKAVSTINDMVEQQSSPPSRKRKGSPGSNSPAPKRSKLDADHDEEDDESEPSGMGTEAPISSMFSGGYGQGLDSKDVRRIAQAVRAVGDVRKLQQIHQNAAVASKSLEQLHLIVSELVAECRKTCSLSTDKKHATLLYQDQPINAHLIVSRVDDCEYLRAVVEASQDPVAHISASLGTFKPWKLGARFGWQTPADDAQLLLGFYLHGCHSMEALAADQTLALASVLAQVGDARLQLGQLLSRFESVIKYLRANANSLSVNMSSVMPNLHSTTSAGVRLVWEPTQTTVAEYPQE